MNLQSTYRATGLQRNFGKFTYEFVRKEVLKLWVQAV